MITKTFKLNYKTYNNSLINKHNHQIILTNFPLTILFNEKKKKKQAKLFFKIIFFFLIDLF